MCGIPCGLCVVGTSLSLGPQLWSVRHRLLLLHALNHGYELLPQNLPRVGESEVQLTDAGGSPLKPLKRFYQECGERTAAPRRPVFNSALLMENFCEATSEMLNSLKAFSVPALLPVGRQCKSRRRRNPSEMFPLKLDTKKKNRRISKHGDKRREYFNGNGMHGA